MDLGRVAYNPHLQRVLESLKSSAMDSLQGPSRYSAAWDKSKLSPSELEEYKRLERSFLKDTIKMEISSQAPPPPQQGPIFIPKDTSSERSHTELEGCPIACFAVGGEKRLCLPQVLQTVLRHLSMDQVQEVCTELHINLSRCSMEQLKCLKLSGDLPTNAPSCGLITKTDAERLCNKLLHSHPETYDEPLSTNSFQIYHECFGKSKGIIIPELYTSNDARCIKCVHCLGLFNPEKFVGHSHKALENRTCHWGFDPANWRSYIHLAKDQDHMDSLQVFLEDLKSSYSRSYKRKECPASVSEHCPPADKRARYYELSSTSGDASTGDVFGIIGSGPTAFRPWSPPSPPPANQNLLNSILLEGKGQVLQREETAVDGRDLPPYLLLHQGPPTLLNPERVVPFDHQKQYERHFAPNVSLAPVPPKKQKCKELAAIAAAAQAAVEEEDRLMQTTTTLSSTSSGPPAAAAAAAAAGGRHTFRPRRSSLHDAEDTDSLSTRSDGSAFSPISSRRPSTEVSSWRAQEVELFKQALDTERTDATARERLMNSYLRAYRLAEDSVAGLASAAKDLQQEVVASNRREVQYRDDLSTLQASLDSASEKHLDQRDQQHQVTAQFRSQLRSREAQYGEMHGEMLRELHRLRDQLRAHGTNVPDITYDFELMGDCPTLVSPPDSPNTSSSTLNSSGCGGGGDDESAAVVKKEQHEEDFLVITVKEEQA